MFQIIILFNFVLNNIVEKVGNEITGYLTTNGTGYLFNGTDYGGSRYQALYTATELSDLRNGSQINNLSIYIDTSSNANLDYSIRLKNTTLTSLLAANIANQGLDSEELFINMEIKSKCIIISYNRYILHYTSYIGTIF